MKKRMIIAIMIVCILVIGVIEWRTKKDFNIDATKVSEIIIDETMDNVKVEVSEDDQIHVSFYEGVSYHYNINEENKILTIMGNNRIPITLDVQCPYLIIRVPKDYGKSIKINTEKNCSIDESIQWKDVQINSEND
jgi:hypothetical protein